MRTMSKWVSLLTTGMLLAATPAFADDANTAGGEKPAKPKKTKKPAKPDDAAKPDAAKPDAGGDAAKPDATKTAKPKKPKKPKAPKGDKTADADKTADKDKDADKDKGGDKDKGDSDKSGSTEVKAGTGIAKRELTGAADTFTKGAKVWVWTSVMGQSGKSIKMVWKKDGKDLWSKDFDVKSSRYRTWTTHKVSPGSYTVEVQEGDGGTVLGSVTFTVS